MKSALFLLTFLPFVLSAEYLVGVGKDETTGKKGKGFDPSDIRPAPGDVIAFEFNAGLHSVVESTFENPCTPKEGGFNTGVITVDNSLPVDADGIPQIRMTVENTEPMYFFDQAGGLCQQGAVLTVNPDPTQIGAFKDNAAKDTDAPSPSSGSPPSTGNQPSGSAPSAGNPSSGTPSGTNIGGAATPSESTNSNGALQVTVPGVALVLFSLLCFM